MTQHLTDKNALGNFLGGQRSKITIPLRIDFAKLLHQENLTPQRNKRVTRASDREPMQKRTPLPWPGSSRHLRCGALVWIAGALILPFVGLRRLRVIIQRGKAAYPRSRGIPVLACVDDAWYEKLSSTFGCPARVPRLFAAKPFTWGC